MAKLRIALPLLLVLALGACATQTPEAVASGEGVPGFLWGVWHGFIFPFAWVGSLFMDNVAVYAVPNNGGWYDFGFFVGVSVLGGGSWFSSRRRPRV